ncbi:DNA cytosine methyltransferase [Cylindrospermopsis raciborskii Cr2010]|uniref:DNA cytosine methyltransferase n=1 Tax=Cylindrospermopsis raciborskii TaxID=77022 RepID=UPI000E1E31CF|nr:DNA cytosine methyltransferase [Cylindrospermopsis raciborskii]UJL33708.1 DNA cytosine methyltransferase [Cylindrospermopsis raciborskii Cr2010]
MKIAVVNRTILRLPIYIGKAVPKRIQTFPDNYRFIGCWTESMRQIGNAVPVELGYFLASSLSRALC